MLLQNCHLGLDYMVELMTLLNETETVDLNFRLFITTEVSPLFPISLLQISIKFTNEPPQGMYHSVILFRQRMHELFREYSV